MRHKIFWCKVNKYYTEKWLSTQKMQDSSWIFIASCVVTDKAKKKWVKFVMDELKNLKNDEKVFISWCWAFEKWEQDYRFFELYPEFVIHRDKIELLPESPTSPLAPLPKGEGNLTNNKIDKISETLKRIFTKKFIVIQGWCDSFCTFCLTVKKRWWHFSRTKEEILEEVLDFQRLEWKEVVLTWVNLCAWWLETTNDIWQSKLSELLNYILDNSDINRIKISSIWPEFITPEVLEIFKNPRIMPHFHFSLQSWASNVLKSMHRHYDWKYIDDLLTKFRNLKWEDWVEISLAADLIVWFPWESIEDFNETLSLVKKHKINKLHAFPFSPHKTKDTVPAWFFPNQIDEKIKKQRLGELIKSWDEIRDEFINSQIWKTFEALIESVKDWVFNWWTQNYIEVNNSNFEVISWDIKRNEIIIWKLK